MSHHSIAFSLHQPDDGDGLALYAVVVKTDGFRSQTKFWGYAEQFTELEEKLNGFPQSIDQTVSFSFGSDGVGQCDLRLGCIDGSGHVATWVTLVAAHPVFPSSEYQRATQCLLLDPASIDSFCQELKSFRKAKTRQAVLYGA